MANELRKTIGCNMRYADMNNQIDNQIGQLQARAAYDLNAQAQINALQQQRDANMQVMKTPMTEQEYAEYNDDGQYIGNSSQPQTTPNTNGAGQMMLDGINHFAQGTTLGWSDEMMGAIGGVGRVAGNGIARAMGYPVNGESYLDAWNKGYQEYRDFACQELQDGYQRNPGISATSEIVGSAMSPITPFKTKGYTGSTLGKFVAHPEDIARARQLNAIGNGVINGVGYTDNNNLTDYITNIGLNVGTNLAGAFGGNKLFGSYNDMYKAGRSIVNGFTDSIPYSYEWYQRRKNGR